MYSSVPDICPVLEDSLVMDRFPLADNVVLSWCLSIFLV